jgi:hypothetical protein
MLLDGVSEHFPQRANIVAQRSILLHAPLLLL